MTNPSHSAVSRRTMLLAAGAGAVAAACGRGGSRDSATEGTAGSVPAGTSLMEYSARDLAAAIRAKRVSPVEALDAALSRIDAVNGQISAIIWRNDDEARAAAKAAADKVVHTDPADLPPFHGVPIPIKDLDAVAGWPLTYGSRSASDAPSKQSAPIIQALQRAGFILTGRTNTPEFGALPATENDRYGITRNPWNLDRTPGGSSGGAAAAVAASMFAVAQASDGAGSIRIPSSYCGLVGLKASRGRVPVQVQSLGTSVKGIVSRTVADTAAVLDVISGPDRGAWYNAPTPSRPFSSEIGADPGRLRIGLAVEAPFGPATDPECATAAREAAAALERIGHHVETTSFRLPAEFVAARESIGFAGVAPDNADWDKVEPHIRASHLRAQAMGALAYQSSIGTLQQLGRELVNRWGVDFDILLTPTMSVMPPRAGEILGAIHEADRSGGDPFAAFYSWNSAATAFTSAFNGTGQPAISLPTHMSPEGIPVGIQLVAGPWEEALLLRVASQLETALPWASRRPPIN